MGRGVAANFLGMMEVGGPFGPIKSQPHCLPGKASGFAGPAVKAEGLRTVDAAAPHASKRRASETEAITLELDCPPIRRLQPPCQRSCKWTALCEEGAHPGKGCKCLQAPNFEKARGGKPGKAQ